jgi:hypothetical protein
MRTPRKRARVSLSRIACSVLPNGECTISHISAVHAQNSTST